MPNYDYQCTQCGHREEILQKITDQPLKECPQCQQFTFKRKFGMGLGLQFQGSGFYCTDYNDSDASAKLKTSRLSGQPGSTLPEHKQKGTKV